ncbi:undecaprenyl-diphosphatase [Fluviicoccus keumensis]|uniref:undecaprenyl-diphosphate phosphatase n=1 Tax=Fluviicoccus keumensis TaxID=1435465 RepID=A0A4Q7YP65_9GAMM|nr:phosphatase PAP2 family protein [Fluviicoccus keumensis]RZU38651.1 undecaprenyl-diphosphatase [Fluviicoccus keumensis]
MNKHNPLSSIPVADWDLAWCLRFNRYSAHRAIAVFFKHISRLGNGRFWYALIVLIAVTEGLPALPLLGQTLLTAGVGVLIYKLLKQRTLRPRPYQVHQAVVLGERPLDHFSFPSGHTLHAVLFTVMLGANFPALLPVLLVFTPLVALSRMVLGLHYPTDVLAGAFLGGGLGVMGLWLF